MKPSKSEILKSILEQLRQLDIPYSHCNAIMADKGCYDESTLISTQEGLLNLIKALLEVACSSEKCACNELLEETNHGGVDALFSNNIKNYFDDFADVWPMCITIAENDEDWAKIVNEFRI